MGPLIGALPARLLSAVLTRRVRRVRSCRRRRLCRQLLPLRGGAQRYSSLAHVYATPTEVPVDRVWY
jgi:hypothetical protein